MEVDDGAAAAASHTTSDASVVLSVGRTPRLRLRFRLLQPQNIIGVSVVEGPLRIESLSLLFAGDTSVYSPNLPYLGPVCYNAVNLSLTRSMLEL